jgi:hypothetical protein
MSESEYKAQMARSLKYMSLLAPQILKARSLYACLTVGRHRNFRRCFLFVIRRQIWEHKVDQRDTPWGSLCGNRVAAGHGSIVVTNDKQLTPRRRRGAGGVFQTICSCGHVSAGDYPAGVTAPVQYGNNLISLVAYLSSRQYITC